MGKGGYYCAVDTCRNNSKNTPGVSFFFFPKDVERAKIWLAATKRVINCPIENLCKKYKICASHFSQKMFKNDLKNRLFDHVYIEHVDQLLIDIDTGVSVNELPIETGHEAMNEVQNNSDRFEVILIEAPSESHGAVIEPSPTTSGISSRDSGSASLERQVDLDNHLKNFKEKMCQTGKVLMKESLTKRQYRAKIRALKKANILQKKKTNILKRKNRILQEKLRTASRGNVTINSLEEYYSFTDKILPDKIANFIKHQVQLYSHKKQGMRYSYEFKKFCLGLFFSGPKAYNILKI